MIYANTSTLALQAMEEERLGIDENCRLCADELLGYCTVCGIEIPDTPYNFVHNIEGNLVCDECFNDIEEEADECEMC